MSNIGNSGTAAASTDMTGRTLGDFQLERILGSGGMGQVYLAKQQSLKRQVAIKVLKPDLAANVTALKRFQAEAEAVARITHANIVQVYAIGEQDGIHYMALEYVEGKNLRDYLDKKGPPELPITLNIMRQVAAALQRAHENGFVHRDIKPENILLTRKGEVKVADFGLSRCFTSDEPLNLTQSGVTMGTPLYMSPEQVHGKIVDPRSDIYSFGVTCYHMLRGEPPFRGATAFEVALQHVQSEAQPLEQSRPDLPSDLIAIVRRMMAKKPEDRYQTAREVLRDLARVRDALAMTQQGIAGVPLLSGVGTISTPRLAESIPTDPQVLLETNPSLPFSRSSAGLRGFLALCLMLAMTGIGAAVHWGTSGPANVSPVSENPATAEKDKPAKTDVFVEREDALKKLVQNPELQPLPRLGYALELIQFYISAKQFPKAHEVAKSLSKYGAFSANPRPDVVGSKKLDSRPSEVFSEVAEGIILAYEDKADASMKKFVETLGTSKPKVLEKLSANHRWVDLLTRESPQWARAISDALHRNQINQKKLITDEKLKPYLQPIPKRGEEPKKP